jgi:hypothetical protein
MGLHSHVRSNPRAGAMVSSSVKQSTFQAPKPIATGAAGVIGVSDEDEHLNQAIAASLVDRPEADLLAHVAGQDFLPAEAATTGPVCEGPIVINDSQEAQPQEPPKDSLPSASFYVIRLSRMLLRCGLC